MLATADTSALRSDVPPWQSYDWEVFCELQCVGFVEEIAAPHQQTVLKSNWILIHSFLLFAAINMYQTHYMKHTMVGSRYTVLQKAKVTPWPDGCSMKDTIHYALTSSTATMVNAVKGKSRVPGCNRCM